MKNRTNYRAIIATTPTVTPTRQKLKQNLQLVLIKLSTFISSGLAILSTLSANRLMRDRVFGTTHNIFASTILYVNSATHLKEQKTNNADTSARIMPTQIVAKASLSGQECRCYLRAKIGARKAKMICVPCLTWQMPQTGRTVHV